MQKTQKHNVQQSIYSGLKEPKAQKIVFITLKRLTLQYENSSIPNSFTALCL